jgi:hypothetical protein
MSAVALWNKANKTIQNPDVANSLQMMLLLK